MGRTWTYSASEFPPIGGNQRLVLMRLREGPLLFISFTHDFFKYRDDSEKAPRLFPGLAQILGQLTVTELGLNITTGPQEPLGYQDLVASRVVNDFEHMGLGVGLRGRDPAQDCKQYSPDLE